MLKSSFAKGEMLCLERTLFDNSLEDIFLSVVEVYRVDNDVNEFRENTVILMNKFKEKKIV